MKLRVLIVDDSPFIRRVLSDWVKAENDMELVGTASDGEAGLEMVKSLKPDVVTMDVEMPKCDGISALKRIMKECPVPVIMVSSVTKEGAEQTLVALEVGAIDFVTKPGGGSSLKFVETKQELLDKIRAARTARLPKVGLARRTSNLSVVSGSSDRVLVIASSTGGPKALVSLFGDLPKGLPVPVLIVQHMPAGYTASLAKRLDLLGGVAVREAKDGDRLEPGLALLAPGGKHMVVDGSRKVRLDDHPPIHGVKPAADFLFKSAVEVFGSKTFGLVLTGMGKDGADGASLIRRKGGRVYGEAEESCVVYGMPRAAKEVGDIDAEYPIDEMAAAVVNEFSRRESRAS